MYICITTSIYNPLLKFCLISPPQGPAYCPGLLAFQLPPLGLGEAPFTASQKLGCNPDSAPSEFNRPS